MVKREHGPQIDCGQSISWRKLSTTDLGPVTEMSEECTNFLAVSFEISHVGNVANRMCKKYLAFEFEESKVEEPLPLGRGMCTTSNSWRKGIGYPNKWNLAFAKSRFFPWQVAADWWTKHSNTCFGYKKCNWKIRNGWYLMRGFEFRWGIKQEKKTVEIRGQNQCCSSVRERWCEQWIPNDFVSLSLVRKTVRWRIVMICVREKTGNGDSEIWSSEPHKVSIDQGR